MCPAQFFTRAKKLPCENEQTHRFQTRIDRLYFRCGVEHRFPKKTSPLISPLICKILIYALLIFSLLILKKGVNEYNIDVFLNSPLISINFSIKNHFERNTTEFFLNILQARHPIRRQVHSSGLERQQMFEGTHILDGNIPESPSAAPIS